ncbi:MAG TPA: metal-dependent hydrolase [Patescibacteria group bacterium]|nr:metal-dependent hydrolase [Patescibacteria group bacterium]
MATIFSHPAVPVALALACGRKTIPFSLLAIGVFCSDLPDFDTIGFAFGVPYESQFGHRGFTHSIVAAILIAALFSWRNREFTVNDIPVQRRIVFIFLFLSTISHALIDALTDGGEGVALWWPFSVDRFFFDWSPIPVSPIGKRFFSERGYLVFATELWKIWAPALVIGGLGFAVRKLAGKSARNS